MVPPDASLSVWLTGLAGNSVAFDKLMTLLACDYFVPVTMSLYLLFLWFGTRDPLARERNQLGAMCSSASLGIANLAVWALNHIGFDPWPRPFEVYESARKAAEIVLYLPHDPSFPANIAATIFAAAMGMYFYTRRGSIFLFVLAFLWSFGRVYAGVHYPLDILGGAVIAVVIAYGMYRGLEKGKVGPQYLLWIAREFYLA